MDINYTKRDSSVRNRWEGRWVKPSINTRADWVQDGKTGAVGELEFGQDLDAGWRAWLMVGGLL
jgi:hypothetical protein